MSFPMNCGLTEISHILQSFLPGGRRVVDNILACGDGEPSSRLVSPVRLTSLSFARWRRSLTEKYNVMGALRGCHAVKFDSCNNLLSFVHSVIVNILHSVSL